MTDALTQPNRPQQAPRRHWQFSVRAFLLFFVLLGLGLSQYHRIRQKRAIDALLGVGARITYSHTAPDWLVRLVGAPLSERVRSIALDGEGMSDADMKWLNDLRSVEELYRRRGATFDRTSPSVPRHWPPMLSSRPNDSSRHCSPRLPRRGQQINPLLLSDLRQAPAEPSPPLAVQPADRAGGDARGRERDGPLG